jgi:hypothetical protein
VDPFVSQPQLTDYTHVLDPWGNALGVDVGTSCLYGRTALRESRAYRYCRLAWGAPGERTPLPHPSRTRARSLPFLTHALAHPTTTALLPPPGPGICQWGRDGAKRDSPRRGLPTQRPRRWRQRPRGIGRLPRATRPRAPGSPAAVCRCLRRLGGLQAAPSNEPSTS